MSRSSVGSLVSNRSFRAHLFWVVLGTTGALLLVSSAAILVPLFLQFEDRPASPEDLGRLVDRILSLHATLWPMVVICLGAVMVSAWLLYRRMVAPLVRFMRVFGAVREGRLPGPIRVRATDYLSHEADALNEMIESLRTRHEELRQVHAELAAQLESLAERASVHQDADTLCLVAALQDAEKALSERLGRVVLE